MTSVLLLGSAETAESYLAAVIEQGWEGGIWSLQRFESLPLEPEDRDLIRSADWILLGSQRAIPALAAEPKEGQRVATVGETTAAACRAADAEVGAIAPNAADLVRDLSGQVDPDHLVVALGPDSDSRLFAALRDPRPYRLACIPVYRRIPVEPAPASPLPLPADVGVLMSPSALAGREPSDLARRWVAFGTSSSEALIAAETVTMAKVSVPAMLEAIRAQLQGGQD